MLYSDLRLGPHILDLTPSTFRKTALGMTAAAAMAGASVFASSPANAHPLPKDECRAANAIVSDLFTRFNGKLSAEFVTSMKSFIAKDCDMATDFKMVDGTQDKNAFGELRVKLIAYRTQVAKPVSLTR